MKSGEHVNADLIISATGINLQKNFPFRKKFEEFYAEYELLSPHYAVERYYQMDKASVDFKSKV